MNEQYYTDDFGVVHQKDPEPFNYDESYIETYDKLGEKQTPMSALRLSSILTAIRHYDPSYQPQSIMDIGYGDGNFLKFCNSAGFKTYGSDVTGRPVPEGTKYIANPFIEYSYSSIVTMFDVLEHFPDMAMIQQLNCDYLALSVPNLPTRDYTSEEFKNWRHRKPNEHLHHFDLHSLCSYLYSLGFHVISYNYLEDMIRKSEGTKPNILSVVCEKHL